MAVPTDNYSVDLEVFQGPLDLLLYLIRKDEIDIYDIPIARITSQYLAYVEMLKLLNLENAGEYILMAATLIRIKTKLLLPRELGDELEEDPREELTRALLEYRKFREAGDILEEKRLSESRLTPVPSRGNGHHQGEVVLAEDTTLFDLLSAFHDILAGLKDDQSYLVSHEEITVESRIKVIQAILAEKESAPFEELFADIRIRLIAVVTFLAILEMVRTRRISIQQAVLFSEIRVYRTEYLLTPYVEPELEVEPEPEPDETIPATIETKAPVSSDEAPVTLQENDAAV